MSPRFAAERATRILSPSKSSALLISLGSMVTRNCGHSAVESGSQFQVPFDPLSEIG